MGNWMDVPPTSTSPPFNRIGGRRLTGSVATRADLTGGERDRMYALLCAHFEGTERAQFEADLAEKESVMLLRDRDTDEIQGFSTLMRIEIPVDGREIAAFFSGDTIVAAEYWGESILSRLWSQMVFSEADNIVAARPSTRVFWFLICSGYKTFRFLPVFFREFYPNPESRTPDEVQRILDTLGRAKFGDRYHAASGIVRLERPMPLRHGIADVTEQRLRDPLVAFFTSRNPGHGHGDELACITEISRSNLTRAGQRMVDTSRPGHMICALANSLWLAGCGPELVRFRRAVRRVEEEQQAVLRRIVSENAGTEFGRAHGFSSIRSAAEYAARVPLTDFDRHQPWIDRMAAGAPDVLTRDPVRLFEPTSGSSGATKLIPYTRVLAERVSTRHSCMDRRSVWPFSGAAWRAGVLVRQSAESENSRKHRAESPLVLTTTRRMWAAGSSVWLRR